MHKNYTYFENRLMFYHLKTRHWISQATVNGSLNTLFTITHVFEKSSEKGLITVMHTHLKCMFNVHYTIDKTFNNSTKFF